MISISPFLHDLRKLFQSGNKDVRFVGGCVRDDHRGMIPKDFDLCTDATPDEQVRFYTDNGLRYIERGRAHGTITVVGAGGKEVYEITSLRVDTECDGRHARVEFTSSWYDDLARRDLTINAMLLDFDGNVYDPFGGRADLNAGVIRFVGDTSERIREDYLRILRYFRFLGRFGDPAIASCETLQAIERNVAGLNKISVERIWSEVSKILVGPKRKQVIELMALTGVARTIGLEGLFQFVDTANPITQLVACHSSPIELSKAWKMSLSEMALARFLHEHRIGAVDYRAELALNGVSWTYLVELAALRGDDISNLADWIVPKFPLSGAALLEAGHKPGKQLGELIRMARADWAASNYTLTQDDLLIYYSGVARDNSSRMGRGNG